MMKLSPSLGIAAAALLIASCSATGGLQPGTSVAFESAVQRSCTDDPIASPLPFKPDTLVGFTRGSLYLSVRYNVQEDGSIEDAVVTSVALGEDALALSPRQLGDIREDIPPQIEASWRHSPGKARVCEQAVGWYTHDR